MRIFTNYKLKLPLIKWSKIVLRNDFIEAFLKSSKLLFDSAAVTILYVKLYIFFLIFLGDLKTMKCSLKPV